MKILIATNNYYPNVNGGAKFSYNLAQGLSKKGHKVYIISPARNFKNSVVREQDVKVYRLRSFVVPNLIYPGGLSISPFNLNRGTIRKILTKLKPDVIHIQEHLLFCNGLIEEGRKMGIPSIGTNHFMPENLLEFLYPFELGRRSILSLGWKHFISVYNKLDLVVTPTQTAVNLLKKIGIKRPVIAISNGIDLKRFNPKNTGSYLIQQYHLPKNKPRVLYVGRIDKEKHLDILIKAFALVLKDIDAHLSIAGKGTESRKLQRLAARLNLKAYITFTGFVPEKDLPSLYRTADIYAIPSIAELQSISTMEAMASGLPVIGAGVMALPELVRHGENGYTFPRDNVKKLAECMIKILTSYKLKNKFGKNSLKIIRNHDVKKTIDAYEEVYLKLQLYKRSTPKERNNILGYLGRWLT